LGNQNHFRVTVANWPETGWQPDQKFTAVIERRMTQPVDANLAGISARNEISRARDLGDSIMTAIVLAPLILPPGSGKTIRFTDLGRLRVQECERVSALRTELTQCGAKIIESGDTLEVFPSALHGAEVQTYNDHRMAMCFAILGLKVTGVKIKNPACVKKTFPNFFQKLAMPPPSGLGVVIRDGRTGRELAVDKLFAD
jgi:3-phosphoshikimate 1-carboxyvinyltransferase